MNQNVRASRPDRGAILRNLGLVVAVVCLLFVGFIGGAGTMWLAQPDVRQSLRNLFNSPASSAEEGGISFRQEGTSLLWEISDILRDEFYDPEALDEQQMMYGAAHGLVSSVTDPYTRFVEPLQASIMEEDMQGSFEGIGATVSMVDGQLVIVRPLAGSPAEKVGLQPGDIILEVDEQSLEGKTQLEAIALIRGPSGTVVRLLVKREGVEEPFIVPVTRDRVESPVIESKMLDGNVAYIRLTEFNAIAEKRLRTALEEMLSQEPVGLIFDLRSNPGGYLQMAIDVSGEFLPGGALVTTEKRRGDVEVEYRVSNQGIARDIPLVVLINGGSASASEIVAGAIRDHDRGILIGQPTLGKGSVQNVHTLQDGSSLRVTTAKFYLPDGESPDGKPIQPDIEVPLTEEDVEAGRDPQLDRAVEYLLNGE
jgi:carboxyl-terminal processing protease